MTNDPWSLVGEPLRRSTPTPPDVTRIAIVGVGPRGLSVLDRVLSLAGARELRVDLLLIEPGELGVGVHRRDQPEYLMLNTVAGQATAFSDSAMVGSAPVLGGPAFLEWCLERGLQPPVLPGDPPRSMAAEEFMPRRVFGDYLAWAACWMLERAPETVRIRIERQIAVNVAPMDAQAVITLHDGRIHEVDLAFVTTGHGLGTSANSSTGPPRVIDPCYPLPESVASVQCDMLVGIAGMGLAAIDVVAALTEGRGGRFTSQDGTLIYEPSGQEPRIHLFNRSGWLASARPNRPRIVPKPEARCLTSHALDVMRSKRPDGLLDFDEDLMPLIMREIVTSDLRPEERRAVERILAKERIIWPDTSCYQTSVLEQAAYDIAQARAGLGRSRFKERLEVLQDCREILRKAVASPGLSARGHRRFFTVLPSMANRAAIGPQIDRLLEFLAVVRAGIASFELGPDPIAQPDATGWWLRSTSLETPISVHVDVLVAAHLHFPLQDLDADPIRRSMLRWASRHPHDERVLNLTSEGLVRLRDGNGCTQIAVLGPPAEGASYYNNYVLWPGTWSRLPADIDQLLESVLASDRPTQSTGTR